MTDSQGNVEGNATRYDDLLHRIRLLEISAARAYIAERLRALEEIQDLMAKHGITHSDLRRSGLR